MTRELAIWTINFCVTTGWVGVSVVVALVYANHRVRH